jgi:acid phosphatase type 7
MTSTPAAARRTRRSLWCGVVVLALVAAVTAMNSCGSSPTSPCTTCGNTNGGTGGGGNGTGGGGGNGGGGTGGGGSLSGTGVLIGAGDIADCDNGISDGLKATTTMLDNLPTGTVFAAGDNAYLHGSAENYANCYAPYWGRHRDRTWPVPGNHDYETAGAAPYYAFFGEAAGLPGQGYWRRTLGTWTVVGLNSELGAGLPGQIQWLKSELGNPANKTPCTLAIWHRPLFSAGVNADATDMRDTWQALYDLGVDVVVNGHEHLYQRFEPQDANGNLDFAKGIRQFTVGTGGASIYNPAALRRNSAMVISYWGLARFTLREGAYDWEFIPIDKGGNTDFGTGQCH